jgi:hypothetical protein
MFDGLDIETKSRLLLSAITEERGEWLEIVVQQMNEDSRSFPAKPPTLDEYVYMIMKRIYYGYLKLPGSKVIKVYCGDMPQVNLNTVYNKMCEYMSQWKDCPSFHVDIVRKVWISSRIMLVDSVKIGKEYLDRDTNCVFEINRDLKQISLFNTNQDMNKFQKRNQDQDQESKTNESSDYTEARKIPDHLPKFVGQGLKQERNGKYYFYFQFNFEQFLKELEDQKKDVYELVVKNSGYEGEKIGLVLKLKAVPLKTPTEEKTHFITLDYFDQDKVKKV